MRSSKISPDVVGKSVWTIHKEYPWNDGEQYEMKEGEFSEEYDVRRQTGYSRARSMFLRSYNFSEDKGGWKKMVKRNLKAMNQKAMMSLLDIRREVLVRWKFGVKVLAVKVDLPMASTLVRCFIPTIKKRKNNA